MPAAEALSLEKEAPSRSLDSSVPQTALAEPGAAFDPFVERLFGGAPSGPPESAAGSVTIQRLKAPVLQRAQRLYGNRASQQIVMRARALQRQCNCGGTCTKCREQEEQRKLQRSSAAAAPAQFDGIPAGSGEPLEARTRRPLEAHFGADLSDVRVHTGSEAQRSAIDLDALAYTSGRDIYFARGMYAPASDSGRRLLAHEVAHVVQQGSGKEPSIATKSSRGVKVGAANDVLETEADQSAEAFISGSPLTDEEQRKRREAGNPVQRFVQRQPATAQATHSSITPEYAVGLDDRTLEVEVNAVRQALTDPSTPEAERPALQQNLDLLEAQVRARNVSPLPAVDPELEKRVAAFKQLVKNAGKLRMEGNRRALQQWRTFLQQKLTPQQFQAQAVAEDMRSLTVMAQKKGDLSWLDQYAQTRNPVMREYQYGVITGTQCPSCHAVLRAEAYEKSTPDWAKTGPAWTPPSDRLAQIAQAEALNPMPRPTFAKEGVLPAPVNPGMYPAAASMQQSLQTIRPYLEQLGPNGYKVLPAALMEGTLSANQLFAQVDQTIQQRLDDYLKFIGKINEPDFDYLELRPIVRDLLPLASADVQEQIQNEISRAENWAIVKGILIGLAAIADLILIIFPPTSAIGVAGVVALEGGLAAASIVGGLEMYQQGQLYALGRGANDVLDPEQQEAANSLMAMGALNVALGALGATGAAFRGVRLIRGPAGGGTTSALESVEAEVGGNKITITKLNTENPQLKITSPDGSVLHEGPLNEPIVGHAQSPRFTWRPNPGGPRTVDEAIAIARKNGIEIPEDIHVTAGKSMSGPKGEWPQGRFAEYAQLGPKNPDEIITWEQFYNRFEQIPVRLNPEVLNSDEAIVAVMGHEMHELNSLRRLFEEAGGQMTAGRLHNLIREGVPGNLHDQAWDVADELVGKMRKAP
jgi:hypothetical protein